VLENETHWDYLEESLVAFLGLMLVFIFWLLNWDSDVTTWAVIGIFSASLVVISSLKLFIGDNEGKPVLQAFLRGIE